MPSLHEQHAQIRQILTQAKVNSDVKDFLRHIKLNAEIVISEQIK